MSGTKDPQTTGRSMSAKLAPAAKVEVVVERTEIVPADEDAAAPAGGKRPSFLRRLLQKD